MSSTVLTPACRKANAYARPAPLGLRSVRRPRQVCKAAPAEIKDKLHALNTPAADARLKYLEADATFALEHAASDFDRPVFPCALIAGDVIILYFLHKLQLLDKIKVVFVDTFHLFPETLDFLKEVEERYSFKALVYRAKDFTDKEAYMAVHGLDLPIRDIDEYDRICKVEPFQRSLAEQNADVMINGRRRDHGAERAHLTHFDTTPTGTANCQPLTYWEFEDVFNFAEKHGIPLHPLHQDGYPSIGDIHTTLPVPRSEWFNYGGERSGRFQGLSNKDGSSKTECGIHNVGDVLEEEDEGAGLASSLIKPKS